MDLTITWQVWVQASGRCPFDDFLGDLQKSDRIKLIARMVAFAKMGWDARAGLFKQMATKSSRTIYEIKNHQQRVLFIRCNDDAVAVTGFTKQTDWGKKEATTLAAAEKHCEQAAEECGGR